MFENLKPHLQAELRKIREDGLWKDERVLASAQGPVARLADGREVLVLCANNYLGLSSDPRVIAAAHRAIDERGYGLSSVPLEPERFDCIAIVTDHAGIDYEALVDDGAVIVDFRNATGEKGRLSDKVWKL